MHAWAISYCTSTAARAPATTTPWRSPSSPRSRTRCTRCARGRPGRRPGTRSWGSSRPATTAGAPTRPSATRSRPSGWRPSWNGRSGPSRRTRGRCRWPPRTDRLPVRYIETDQSSRRGIWRKPPRRRGRQRNRGKFTGSKTVAADPAQSTSSVLPGSWAIRAARLCVRAYSPTFLQKPEYP